MLKEFELFELILKVSRQIYLIYLTAWIFNKDLSIGISNRWIEIWNWSMDWSGLMKYSLLNCLISFWFKLILMKGQNENFRNLKKKKSNS